MRDILSAILVGIAFIGAPSSVEAAYYVDGNTLYEDCSATQTDAAYYGKSNRCSAFVVGVLDAWSLERERAGKPKCTPQGVTIGQAADIVTKFLRDNPALRHWMGVTLVQMSFVEAYPACAN